MSVKFTQEEREKWIKWAKEVAYEFGIECGNLHELSDSELDEATSFLHELTLK